MTSLIYPRLLFILGWISTGLGQQFFSPPTLSVDPRQWNIPIDTPIGHFIAKVKVRHESDETATFRIEKSHSQLQFLDGSQYFVIQRTPKENEGTVRLQKLLTQTFKVGDKLSLSITGMINGSSVTARNEVYIVITEAIHSVPIVPSLPILNPRPTDTPISNNNIQSQETTTTKDPNINNVSEEPSIVPGKLSTSLIILIALIFVFIIPLIVALYCYREKLFKARNKYCNYCIEFVNSDKDGADTENANSEFQQPGDLQLKKSSHSSNNGNVYDITAGTGNAITDFDPKKWEIPRSRIRFNSINDRIGEGCFGVVYRGVLENNPDDNNSVNEYSTVVAIKTLKINATEKDKKDLLNELAIMKMLEPHPNVVSLLGCCTDKDPLLVIMEYINGSTLQDFLKISRNEHNYKNLHAGSKSLSSRDLTSFAYQIAKGMEYISSKKLIHRDLAARNVLIENSDQCCKVADFGFARDIMANNIYERKSEGKLPIRWMAPESLYDNVYSVKSDIWSFGILMWEVVTLGSTPYTGLHPSEVMKKVRDGYRLEKPEHCKRELYNIMVKCWEKSADNRPTFSDLVRDFEALLVREMDYIDLNMFEEDGYHNAAISLSGERV